MVLSRVMQNGFKLDGPPGAQGPREGGAARRNRGAHACPRLHDRHASLADLVHVGLATEEPETSKGHGQTIKVVRVRITDAGRDALAAEA